MQPQSLEMLDYTDSQNRESDKTKKVAVSLPRHTACVVYVFKYYQ
jgi:hypothetical protein